MSLKRKKLKNRIRRDYFDIAPNKNPEAKHRPDADTHSIILQAVENRLWKISLFLDTQDILLFIHDKAHLLLPALLSGISLYCIMLQQSAKKKTQDATPWIKEWIAPYIIPVCSTIILICIAWILWRWISKRIHLLKAVRNQEYLCTIRPQRVAVLTDGILEVAETNCPEGYVRFVVYYSYGNFISRYAAILDLAVEIIHLADE